LPPPQGVPQGGISPTGPFRFLPRSMLILPYLPLTCPLAVCLRVSSYVLASSCSYHVAHHTAHPAAYCHMHPRPAAFAPLVGPAAAHRRSTCRTYVGVPGSRSHSGPFTGIPRDLRVTKLAGVMRMDIGALVRLPSACCLSVPPPPPQLPLQSGHVEHLLSERRLLGDDGAPPPSSPEASGHSGARKWRMAPPDREPETGP
jgi:hypothetical protein